MKVKIRMKDKGRRMKTAQRTRACISSSFILHPSSLRPSAFTLTEILIVMGLIVLIIGLAVPAFNLISGARSVDAGENLVAAMLSRARAEAIKNHRMARVAFFHDVVNDRSAMALAVPASDRAGV